MSEIPDRLRLSIGDEIELDVTPENTTLYTFLGKTMIGDMEFNNSSANHIFIAMDEDEKGRTRGMYLFEAFHPVYKTVADFAIKHSLPGVVNSREVGQSDLQAYMLQVDKTISEFSIQIPDEL